MRYIIVQSTRIRYDVRTRSFSEGMNECRMIYSSIWFLDNKKKMGLQDTQRAIAKFQVKVKVAKACHFSFSFFCLFDTYIRTYKNNNARQFQKEREAAMTKKTKTIEEILNWWNIGNYCTLEDGLAFHFTFDGSNWSNAERVPDKQLTALILQLKWKRLGTIGEQPNGGITWRTKPGGLSLSI